VNSNKSLLRDFIDLLISPKQFFKHRFLKTEPRRIFLLGFIGVFLGLVVGSFTNYLFISWLKADFLHNKKAYVLVLQNLQFSETSFLDLLTTQTAYCLLVAILSPAISYMAPHILGGALFISLKLFTRPKNPIEFFRVLECSAASLGSMFFYMVPGIGPIIAVILVAVNVSRALFMQYQLTGFMKIMSILSALYVAFFLTNITLQLLAHPFSRIF
jgi:hypothetical protein